MYELIPIAAGVLSGLTSIRLRSAAAGAVLITAVAVVAALVAGFASGELERSWAFFLWDFSQAVLAAVLSRVAVRVMIKRGGAIRAGDDAHPR